MYYRYTEILTSNRELYISQIFDGFDLSVNDLAMEINMEAYLCIQALEKDLILHIPREAAIIYSDSGTLRTSESY